MASHELRLAPEVSEIPRLSDWVAARCHADGIDDDTAFKLTLAIEEAVVNVMRYAFDAMPPPHIVMLRLDTTADSVAAELIDNGRPFDPTQVPGPDLSLPVEKRNPGGLGIHLLHRLMDRVQYRRIDGNNVLRLEKSRG